MGEVAGSIEELVKDATFRGPMNPGSMSRSNFERVVIDGGHYVLKYLSWDLDWVTRVTADISCRVLTLWRTGVLDRLPGRLDHTIVGVAREGEVTALLMRDVSGHLVPTGDDPIPLAQHTRFLDHMAALHATFLGIPEEDQLGLLSPESRCRALSPGTARRDAEAGNRDPGCRAIPVGWRALDEAAPEAAGYACALAADPAPLADALADTPATLVHGDWKASHLGSHPDGRTILLDWAWPGRDAPCVDLARYLAVNWDRLPEAKEAAIERFRSALESHGVRTREWWERQLNLALLDGFVQLGWSKSGDELGWWVERTLPAARELLGRRAGWDQAPVRGS
ncbi:hypothetical protein Aph01nite_73000 [Acrocarpospora phusangensis]|uniref:Aminoglycoside phosphotransferase n=1 Tax=Acrocarpospora phusangensis TaxID=1070424 RepID=A0A919QMI7_9ACTN|nr:hypothetical protein [Acrocarpospora phusangensis]GIH28990.1 hypothetical protein Aph01nite_73000 [Acrocarpospora phusangensis]